MDVNTIKNAIADYAVFSTLNTTMDEFFDFYFGDGMTTLYPNNSPLPETPMEIFDALLRVGLTGRSFEICYMMHQYSDQTPAELPKNVSDAVYSALVEMDSVYKLTTEELIVVYTAENKLSPLSYFEAAELHPTEEGPAFLDAYRLYCLQQNIDQTKHSSFYNYCVKTYLENNNESVT